MFPVNRSSRRTRAMATFAGAAVALAAAGCASAAPYNPAHLDQAGLQAVGGVCQSVMGLSVDEPLIPGTDDPRLDPLENHYQGCVATLSNALDRAGRTLALQRAEQDCGQAGTGGDHALCVLKAEKQPYAPARIETVSVTASPATPFFGLTPRQWSHRTERACASIGLDPAGVGFDACVKEMTDTFYAIDNPWR